MTQTTEPAAQQQRDRSPAYPVVALEAALSRLAEFDAHFKRMAARPEKVGEAWDINAKAHADRTVAALRYFGLLEYQGAGKDRRVAVSEEGRKYLRAQQEETKREVVKSAALRPKQIVKFWNEWGPIRPADAACIDELVFKNRFSEGGAREFLKVYDATISFAKLSDSDKNANSAEGAEDEPESCADIAAPSAPSSQRPPVQQRAKIMAGERELTTGLLSKDTNFRLIVSGPVGVKEIERLIRKLELDKEILAEQGEDDEAAN